MPEITLDKKEILKTLLFPGFQYWDDLSQVEICRLGCACAFNFALACLGYKERMSVLSSGISALLTKDYTGLVKIILLLGADNFRGYITTLLLNHANIAGRLSRKTLMTLFSHLRDLPHRISDAPWYLETLQIHYNITIFRPLENYSKVITFFSTVANSNEICYKFLAKCMLLLLQACATSYYETKKVTMERQAEETKNASRDALKSLRETNDPDRLGSRYNFESTMIVNSHDNQVEAGNRFLRIPNPSGIFRLFDALLEIGFALRQNAETPALIKEITGDLLDALAQSRDIFTPLMANYKRIKGSLEYIQKVQNFINELKVENANNINQVDLQPHFSDQVPVFTVQNLLYEYKDAENKDTERKFFTDLNIEIGSNEFVLISGNSGIGKTTFFKLLQRHILPQEGAILICGKPLQTIPSLQLNSLITFIPAELPLFDDKPVIFNILYKLGPKKIPDDDLVTIYEMKTFAKIYEFMKENEYYLKMIIECKDKFEKFGLDCEIMRRSDCKGLSGGEKRRIGLIIALLRDTPIMLFDEITANLDPDSAKRVVDTIYNLKNTTRLVITHDPDLFPENGVRKLELKQGEFIERHPHLICDNRNAFFQPSPRAVNAEQGNDEQVEEVRMRAPRAVLMEHA